MKCVVCRIALLGRGVREVGCGVFAGGGSGVEGECRFEEALRKAHRGGRSRGEVAAGAAPGGRAEGEADVDPQSGRVPVCLRSGQGASAALESEGQRVGESAACRPSVTRGSWRLRGGRVAASRFDSSGRV